MKLLRKLWKRFQAWRYGRKYGFHKYEGVYAYRCLRPNHIIPIIFKRDGSK